MEGGDSPGDGVGGGEVGAADAGLATSKPTWTTTEPVSSSWEVTKERASASSGIRAEFDQERG